MQISKEGMLIQVYFYSHVPHLTDDTSGRSNWGSYTNTDRKASLKTTQEGKVSVVVFICRCGQSRNSWAQQEDMRHPVIQSSWARQWISVQNQSCAIPSYSKQNDQPPACQALHI